MKENKIPPLSIVYQGIDQLKPFASNARTHSKSQIRQIARSIRVFGFTNPVLVDRNNRIIAGHGRVEAAKLEGMTDVPTIRLEDLSEDQIRAYVIADNKLAENAGWDRSILAIELQHLSIVEGLDFDVTITGYEVPEIDIIIEGHRNEQWEDPDDSLPSMTGEPVTEPGDVWQLGKHRIVCGDSRNEFSMALLMNGRKAQMIWTDPPYNVRIDGYAPVGVVVKMTWEFGGDDKD